MSFTLPADFTTPPADPNAPPDDPGNLTADNNSQPDPALDQQLADAAAAAPPDQPPTGDEGNLRHVPAPDAASPTADIYNAIYDAQGGNAPTGSPTEPIYDAIIRAQGGNPPQGPDLTPPTPAAASVGLPGSGGAAGTAPDALAAGPGWYVDAHGRFVSDNMGANARANQPFERNVALGPNTVIDLPGKALTDYGTGQHVNAAGLGPQGITLDPGLMNLQHNGTQTPYAPTAMGPPGTIGGIAPTGGLPGGGAPAAANAGAPGSFAQEFQQRFGYYDPRFNSQANMEQNLLRGDSVIRPQAEYMAQFDPNLKAELATINGLPDFYQSQNAANWDAAHNQQLVQRVANGEIPLAAAQGQGVNVPGHPVDNAHALATQGMQDTLVKTLTQMGVDPQSIQQTFDPYGNAKLTFTSASGKPQVIDATLVGYANAIEQLRQNVAAAAPPPGGGAPPRYAPPRGGGYAPPAAAAQPPGAPSVMPTGLDVQNPTGSSAGYDQLAAQRLAAFDTMGPGGTRPNVPRDVASAVAYSPALTPGGYSPYDQP